VAAVERVSGRRVPVREAQRRPGDPPELVADPAKARELLGWKPRHSSLENIVQTAWNWLISRKPTLGGVDAARRKVDPLREPPSDATAASQWGRGLVTQRLGTNEPGCLRQQQADSPVDW